MDDMTIAGLIHADEEAFVAKVRKRQTMLAPGFEALLRLAQEHVVNPDVS